MNGSMFSMRYKDCDPLQTVTRIRNILSELNILTTEEWKQDIEGYYSLNLSVIGANIFSNGKGTSYEYAMASAYGEFMERLQNLLVVKSHRGMRSEALRYKGFIHAPDEKHIGIDDILKNREKWLEVFTFEAADEEEKRMILEKWKTADYYSGISDFIALPYLNTNGGSIHHIPVIMLLARYGSNGMCAGNTAEEALVQGISETIERYVNYRIVKDRITPPTVPDKYIIENCPFLYNMIQRLENKGDFKVIIKDCSLGQGFPVVGAVILSKRQQSYFIKFGAHPVFEIALERCLTELLQGKELNNLNWMSNFSYMNNETETFKNVMDIFVDGRGYYPLEFFSENYSYGFSEFEYTGSCCNKDMLSYLLGLVKKKGYDVLIRDVSFLDFPSFHVVIPFFSEMNDSNHEIINRLAGRRKAARTLSGLEKADRTELQQVIDFMYENDYSPFDSIVKALHLSLGSGFAWNNIKRDLFICSAYYKIGDYKKAYKAMDSFLREMVLEPGSKSFEYYRCIRDHIGARADGVHDESWISGILKKFYHEQTVDKVISDMREPERIFRNCSGLECFECSKCFFTKFCVYDSMERIYLKLKQKYAENPIDQKKLVSLYQ